MSVYSYPKFLDDEQQYDCAQADWEQRWNALIDQVDQGRLWQTPWLNTKLADGTPLRDGNPMLSAYSSSLGLGIRLIQREPFENTPDFSFWIDTFDKGSPDAIQELVISCAMTDETALQAVDLMKQWMLSGEIQLVREGPCTTFPSVTCTPDRCREYAAA